MKKLPVGISDFKTIIAGDYYYVDKSPLIKELHDQGGETKEAAFAKAFQQIEDRNYAAELHRRGVEKIRKLVLVFKGKQMWVKEKPGN